MNNTFLMNVRIEGESTASFIVRPFNPNASVNIQHIRKTWNEIVKDNPEFNLTECVTMMNRKGWVMERVPSANCMEVQFP